MFDIKPHKAPGIDEIHAFFYQRYSYLVAYEAVKFVNDYFQGKSVDASINESVIVLIPKIVHPKEVKDFRPISICNLLYKVASKALANRIKKFFPWIISES